MSLTIKDLQKILKTTSTFDMKEDLLVGYTFQRRESSYIRSLMSNIDFKYSLLFDKIPIAIIYVNRNYYNYVTIEKLFTPIHIAIAGLICMRKLSPCNPHNHHKKNREYYDAISLTKV